MGMNNGTTNQLETMACSRCAGSGHYSYCQMYGTRCFKCGGSGKVYTKRGRTARNYLETIRSKPAGELVHGDVVRYGGVPGISGDKWVRIMIVKPSELRAWVDGAPVDASGLVDYEAFDRTGMLHCMCGLAKDSLVRVAQSAEQKAETFERAMAYQATLTKTGTPRKRAVSKRSESEAA